MNHDSSSSAAADGDPMGKLLAKLSEQKAAITQQHQALKSSDETDNAYARTVEYVAATSVSVPIIPVTESLNPSTAPTTSPPSIIGEEKSTPSAEEVLRLKAELEIARAKMARMDQELAQSRITKHTLDQAIGNASEADYPLNHQPDERHVQLPPSVRPQIQRDNSWAAQDDTRSDTSDAMSASGFARTRTIWGNGGKQTFPGLQSTVPVFQPSEAVNTGQWMNRGFGQQFIDSPMAYPVPPISNFRSDRMTPDPEYLMAPSIARRTQGGVRFNNRSSAGSYPYASSNSSFDGYTPSSTQYGSVGGMAGGVTPMGGPTGIGLNLNSGMNSGMNMYGYQPQPIGTPLSPHAPEFTSSNAGWKNDVSTAMLYCKSIF